MVSENIAPAFFRLETKSLSPLLLLYLLTISGLLGNFFMWSFRRFNLGGKVGVLSANPFSLQTMSAQQQPYRSAIHLSWDCFVLIMYYFTLLSTWDIPDKQTKNWSNCDLISCVLVKGWEAKAKKYENKGTEGSARKTTQLDSWRSSEHKWHTGEMPQGQI